MYNLKKCPKLDIIQKIRIIMYHILQLWILFMSLNFPVWLKLNLSLARPKSDCQITKHYNICSPFPGLTACSSGSFGAGGSSMAFGGSLGGSSMALGRLFIICLISPTVTWRLSGLQFYSVKYSANYQWQKHENNNDSY